MSGNTPSTGYAGTVNVSMPSTPKKTSSNANKTSNAPKKPQSPPKFEFELDRLTKEQMLIAMEKSQRDDDDQPLLCIQESQSETKIEEKKLADLPMVKAFNEAERKRMSQSK